MSLHEILLLAHISVGTVALVSGVVAASIRKGGRTHRQVGRIFVMAGWGVVVTALMSTAWALFGVDSFIGDDLASESDPDRVRALVRLFVGVLGALGLLAAGDLAVGTSTVRFGVLPRIVRQILAWATAAAGVLLVAAGVWALTGVIGPLGWFGVGVGAIAIGEGWGARDGVTTVRTLEAHIRGMLGALTAFAAAFSIFGFGRFVSFDLVEGDPLGIIPVAVVAVVGWALTRWWIGRIDDGWTPDAAASDADGSDHAPPATQMPER